MLSSVDPLNETQIRDFNPLKHEIFHIILVDELRNLCGSSGRLF